LLSITPIIAILGLLTGKVRLIISGLGSGRLVLILGRQINSFYEQERSIPWM
jgi:hypothetical protein